MKRIAYIGLYANRHHTLLFFVEIRAKHRTTMVRPFLTLLLSCRVARAFTTPPQWTLPRYRGLLVVLAESEHPFEGNIESLAYHRLDILSDGTLNSKSTVDALSKWITSDDKNLKYLWVVSHGWNTKPDSAWQSYNKLFAHVAVLMEERDLSPANFGIVGITWNSITRQDPFEQIEEYRKEFPEDAKNLDVVYEKAQALVDLGEDPSTIFDEKDQDDALKPGSSVKQRDERDKGRDALDAAIAELFQKGDDYAFDLNFHDSLDDSAEDDGDDDDETNQPTLRGEIFGSEWPNPFNFYFIMKRAAKLGQQAVSPTLKELGGLGLGLHLVGHSFGALLVSTAANENGSRGDYASMSLLQGAYSHNAFAEKVLSGWKKEPKRGMFRDIVENKVVSGPIAVTHTKKDFPLLYLYPLAARSLKLEGTTLPGAKLFPGTPFGAIGADGAQGLVEEDEVNDGKLSDYKLVSGKLNNLEADNEISGHSEVWNEHVARLLIEVVKAAE